MTSRRRYPWRNVCCTGVFLVATVAPALAASDAVYWNIRAVAGLPPKAQIELARSSEPLWHTVGSEEGVTLRQVVEEVCGEQAFETESFLLSEAMRINLASDLDKPLKSGTAVAVPFCLKLVRNIPVTIRNDDTPEGILKRHYGVYGPKTLASLYNLNAAHFPADNLQELAVHLPVGREIILPYAAPERVFAVAPGSDQNLPDILASLDRESLRLPLENTIEVTESSPERQRYQFEYVQTVDFAAAGSDSSCEGQTLTDAFRIVDLDLLSERFSVEEQERLTVGDGAAQPTIVGIIDTGIATPGDEFFELRFFQPNGRERNGIDHEDDDRPPNNFVDDIFGINFNTKNGRIEPYPTDSEKSHGTKMAALILGGPAIAHTWTGAFQVPMIRLKAVNFSSSRPAGGTVGAENLANAITYLTKQGSSIVNMSLTNSENIWSVSNAIQLNQESLFIVAAGNAKVGEGKSINSNLIFPARYGGRVGDHKRNVVTVGAHDLEGRRADFSNYSKDFVDLLAPGCAIETRDIDGSTIRESGTSPATAIVSFASGLVAALGETKANNIKNRLLISTDPDERLKDDAWSSGRLNIVKAISLRRDVIELATAPVSYQFVKMTADVSLTKYCGDDDTRTSLRNIQKVIPNIPGQDGQEIEYWEELDGILSKRRCKQVRSEEGIGKVKVNNAEEDGPPLSTVSDIILSSF